MLKLNWNVESSGLIRDIKLTITDIERLRDLRNLIEASANKLTMMEQNPDSNFDEIAVEKTILKASKHSVEKLEHFILLFETQ